jgi:hypothetical protein
MKVDGVGQLAKQLKEAIHGQTLAEKNMRIAVPLLKRLLKKNCGKDEFWADVEFSKLEFDVNTATTGKIEMGFIEAYLDSGFMGGRLKLMFAFQSDEYVDVRREPAGWVIDIEVLRGDFEMFLPDEAFGEHVVGGMKVRPKQAISKLEDLLNSWDFFAPDEFVNWSPPRRRGSWR